MKVSIGKYKSWFGPYQLAEVLCFWAREEKDEYGFPKQPDWVHNFGEWLAHGSLEPKPQVGEVLSWHRERHTTWLYRLLLWIDRCRGGRRIRVRIDPWDTWSMDHTLGYIILPMLKQLRDTKHGAPYVDDADVPEHLRSTSAPVLTQEEQDCGAVDANHFARWDWVLDEMIFAFECQTGCYENWEDQFHSGESYIQFQQLENGWSEMIRGPNDTHKWDQEGQRQWHDRMQNGYRLFGKYYQSLWD
jgi:hypothetical protein